MKQSELKAFLREIVKETLDEMTGTGAVGGYQTPFAFQGKGDADRKRKIAADSMPGGKVVGEGEPSDDKTEEELLVRRSLGEARSRYLNYRDSDAIRKASAKVSYGIREAYSMLREVEFLVGMCERLKVESGTTNDQLWKRTGEDIGRIHNRLKEIARRVKRLQR